MIGAKANQMNMHYYGAGPAFDPVATFFGGSEAGLITDLSDLGNLWQNTNGTGAVTAVDDPIGRIDDVSGNGNHLTANSTKGVLKQDGNGKYYVDTTNGAFYVLTSVMSDLRSVCMVLMNVSSGSYVPFVGHASQYDFHGNTPAGRIMDNTYASADVYNGDWKLDGSTITPSSTDYPSAAPKVLSCRTLANSDGGYISRDRNFNNRELRGRIYEVFLNSADVGATDMASYKTYLDSKFSL
jgi:hypothetical protein